MAWPESEKIAGELRNIYFYRSVLIFCCYHNIKIFMKYVTFYMFQNSVLWNHSKLLTQKMRQFVKFLGHLTTQLTLKKRNVLSRKNFVQQLTQRRQGHHFLIWVIAANLFLIARKKLLTLIIIQINNITDSVKMKLNQGPDFEIFETLNFQALLWHTQKCDRQIY